IIAPSNVGSDKRAVRTGSEPNQPADVSGVGVNRMRRQFRMRGKRPAAKRRDVPSARRGALVRFEEDELAVKLFGWIGHLRLQSLSARCSRCIAQVVRSED